MAEANTCSDQRADRLVRGGAVAVLRFDRADPVLSAAEAIHEGGITSIEITLTTPEAPSLIERVRQALAPDALVGAGSVRTVQEAKTALQAGAEFVVGPVCIPEIVEVAHRQDAVAVPGALTPTEVYRAHTAGADLVKVFPASTVGKGHLKALAAPLPPLSLMPTGGISLEDAGTWIRAGASVVGIGSALEAKQAIEAEQYEALTDRARRLRQRVEAAREDRP